MSPAPFTSHDAAIAAPWLEYLDGLIGSSGRDASTTIVEAIDKLSRRGLITEGTAELLADVFDVPSPSSLSFS